MTAMKNRVYGNPQLANYFVNGGFRALFQRFTDLHQLSHPHIASFLRTYQDKDRIPMLAWWQALDVVAECLPQQQALGLQIGVLINPTDMGVFGYLSASSDTLGNALKNFERFQRLAYEGNPGEFIVDGQSLKLRWGTELGIANRLVNDTALAVLITFLRKATGISDLTPTIVHSIYDAPNDIQLYSEFFGVTPTFNAPFTEMQFPLEYLNTALPANDMGLQRLLESQAQQLLSNLPSQDQFLPQLADVILKSLHVGQPTVEFAAAHLCMSERTLHRRLADRGFTFQQQLLAIRKKLVLQYLQDSNLSLTSIALLLGYSEQSAFSRAFRLWFANSPNTYRKKLRGR